MSHRALRSALCLMTLVGALTLVAAEPQARPFCQLVVDCFGVCIPDGFRGCVCWADGQVVGSC